MHFLLLKLNFLAAQQFTQENVLSVILQVTAVSLYSSITAFSGALRHLTPDICTVLAAHTVLLPSRTLLVSSYHKSFSRHADSVSFFLHISTLFCCCLKTNFWTHNYFLVGIWILSLHRQKIKHICSFSSILLASVCHIKVNLDIIIAL